jgi:protein involved in polysaccharide export with SLBB domain
MNRLIIFAAVIGLAVTSAAAQSKNRNNPYTPSPTSVAVNVPKPQPVNLSVGEPAPGSALTHTYKVGGGDVLFIDILNSGNGKGFYGVRTDGTIDFPLAGENVKVEGKTVHAIYTNDA